MALHQFYNRTLVDYDGEKTSFRCVTQPLTAANFDVQTGLAAALGVAMAGITLGEFAGSQIGNVDPPLSSEAANPMAQRELKWLVLVEDTVTSELFTYELGTADPAMLDPNDRKHANIGDAGPVDTFISALEAYAYTKNGNALEVKEITLVGRNI